MVSTKPKMLHCDAFDSDMMTLGVSKEIVIRFTMDEKNISVSGKY